jgi:Sec-independent protein secretion pathway component TatC
MGIIFTVLFAVELFLSLFYKKWKEEKRTGFDFKFAEGIDEAKVKRRTIEAFVSIFVYFALVLIIGFVYAIPVFFLLYFRFVGREGWKKSILITAIGWLAFYLIFIWGMKNSYPDSWLYQISTALGIVK